MCLYQQWLKVHDGQWYLCLLLFEYRFVRNNSGFSFIVKVKALANPQYCVRDVAIILSYEIISSYKGKKSKDNSKNRAARYKTEIRASMLWQLLNATDYFWRDSYSTKGNQKMCRVSFLETQRVCYKCRG
jgi:hypothetical protein